MRVEQPTSDPTREAGYAEAVEQLKSLNREAEDLFRGSRPDDAAAVITPGQLLQARLLAPPRPTLAAIEGVSDLDDLCARLLLSNTPDGWNLQLVLHSLDSAAISCPTTAKY